jgi:methyl-accepting chemotaxis protein
MTKHIQPESLLISAASISADLNEVSRIAKHISVGVKNAKAIAARAGNRARGFQPITDFINEMATDIMSLVDKISREALDITRIASQHSRTLEAKQRLDKVYNDPQGGRYKGELRGVTDDVNENVEQQRYIIRQHARSLDLLLSEIAQKVKAAQVISNTSRVEASRAGEYRPNLEVVADNLETETNQIKEHVARCQTRLSNMFQLLN